MMPLLVLLFVVSYSILTALVFEQGQTIEAQRGLIREMLKDSTQLAALKGKLARDEGKRNQEKGAAEQKKATGNSAAKGADPKGLDKDAKRSGKSTRSLQSVPQKPEADLQDVRRATSVI
jgi:hypothetical protein